jgi:predicted metal-dependent hydrolase
VEFTPSPRLTAEFSGHKLLIPSPFIFFLNIQNDIWKKCGRGGIRTHGPLRDTAFREPHFRPLRHPSRCEPACGEGGIRTHGTVSSTTVFKTVAIDHSATSPICRILAYYGTKIKIWLIGLFLLKYACLPAGRTDMNHQIIIDGKQINYTIKKSRLAGQLRLMIHANGRIAVSVPRFVTQKFIKNFLLKKQDWILNTLAKCRPDDPQKNINAHNDYRHNKKQALHLVLEKIKMFDPIYGLRPKKIFIRNQSTRWGSCSSKGNLSFNFRLIYLPEPLLDYLVVHELCHLREMNHSQRFWSLVAKTIPDYKKRKAVLRVEGRRLL